MSLLQSNLRHAQLVACWFAAVSCSFDSGPRTTANGNATRARDASVDAAPLADPPDAGAPQDSERRDEDSGRAPPAPATDKPPRAPIATMVMSNATPPSEPARDAGSERDAGQSKAEPTPTEPAPTDAGAARDAAPQPPPARDPHCREGVYAGTFSGSIQLIGLSLSSVTGTVRAELMRNQAGTYLEMRDASVMGVDQDGNSLTVKLSGNISCTTKEFVDGTLTDGVFHNVNNDSDTPFTGTADGTYSEDPHSVIGTFTVQANDFPALLTGRGTWNVIFSE